LSLRLRRAPPLQLACLMFVLVLGFRDAHPALAVVTSTQSAISNLSLDIRFDPQFPTEWTGYVRDFYYTIYPEMETFCGPPIKSGTLLVKYDATRSFSPYYDQRSNTILMGRLPGPSEGRKRDIWWDLSFAEAVSRAFHGPIALFANWAYGMNRAIANLVMMSIGQEGKLPVEYANWVYATKTYDSLNYLGGEVVAGATWGTKVAGSPFWNLREGIFLLLAFSLPNKQTGQFDYLAKVLKAIIDNARWHKKIDLSRESYFYVDRSLFDTVLDEAAEGQRIDGLSPSQWVRRQAVTFEDGTKGPRLGVYIDDVENPWRITVFSFDRQFNPKNPREGFENPLKNLLVWVRVIDWKGDLVYSGNVTTGDDGRAWARPNWKLGEGGYAVLAEANYQGVRLSCKGYAINLGRQGSILGPSNSLMGIFLDDEGEPISGSLKTTLGRLEFARNGVWSIDMSGLSGPVETLLNSNSAERRFTKPGPFMRIVPMPARGVGSDLRSVFWGKVTDAETGLPVVGVQVKIYQDGKAKTSTNTDSQGNYRAGVRGEYNYTIVIVPIKDPSKLCMEYVPVLDVVDTKNSANNLLNFRLHRAAVIFLSERPELFDVTRISSVNITVMDAQSGNVLDLDRALALYGDVARHLGLDPRCVIVPADREVKLKLDVAGTFEDTSKGFRLTKPVNRSFTIDERFYLKSGQAMTLDMRRLSMSFNLQVLASLITKAGELLRKAEEYGFYVVAEKKDLAIVNRLSSSAQDKVRQEKFDEGFSDAKEGYLKAGHLLDSISTAFSESYWSALALVFFLAFCAAAIATFAFEQNVLKLAAIIAVYFLLWYWLYLSFPGCRIVPSQQLVTSSAVALGAAASLCLVTPAAFGRARGSISHLSTVFSLAKRNLRRRRLRTALLTVTMMTLILSFVSLTSFSVEYGLQVKAVSGAPPADGALVRENPIFDARFRTLAPIAPDVQEWVLNREGVLKVIPKLESMPEARIRKIMGRYVYDYLGDLRDPAENNTMNLFGAVALDPKNDPAIAQIHPLVVEGRLFEENEMAVLISVEAAKLHGFQVGDELILSSATRSPGRQRLAVTLVGLLDDRRLASASDLDGQPILPRVVTQIVEENAVIEITDYCETQTIALLNIATAERLPGTLSLSRLSVIAKSPEAIPIIARTITLGRDMWVWFSVNKKIQLMQLTSYVETRGGFLIVPLILVAVNLGAAIYMAISERKRETNTLSTLGVNPTDITRIFVGEAIFIALLGAGIGYLSGMSFYNVMSRLLLNPEVRQKVSASWSVAVLALAMAVSLAGAHIPSKKAAVLSTPIRLMRWRMGEAFSELGGWKIRIPLKVETTEVDRFMNYFANRLQKLDETSDHVENLKMINKDSSDAFDRRLEFRFMITARGELRTGFGTGSFFMVRTSLSVSGDRKQPLDVEVTCSLPRDAKVVAYQVADFLRKIALEWSASK